jgi:hypothetical protein
MADAPRHPAVDRIERAVARIEKAASARAFATDRALRRHGALRARIEQAVAALDVLIAREDAEERIDNGAGDQD